MLISQNLKYHLMQIDNEEFKNAIGPLPEELAAMKNSIKNEYLINIYSQFDFLYFNPSKSKINNDKEKIKSILHYALNEFSFLVYCFIDDFCPNLEEASKSSKNHNNLENNSKSNIFICAEKKCFIINQIDLNLIKQILNEINSKQLNMSTLNKNLLQSPLENQVNSDILNFCQFFSKNGQFENIFVQCTLSSLACYLIRRFFYPSKYFKDQTFFCYKSKSQLNEQKYINLFNDCFNSKNIEQISELNDEIKFDIEDNDQNSYDDFNENN